MKALHYSRINQTDFDLLFRSNTIWQELADDYRFLVNITDRKDVTSIDKIKNTNANSQTETKV